MKDVAVTDGWEMQSVRFEPGARFPIHSHQSSEFVFILEGELVQAGRRLGPGYASVASPGTVDEAPWTGPNLAVKRTRSTRRSQQR